MIADSISSLIIGGQRDSVAFELETVAIARLAETLSAFANADGGLVLIGVDPRASIVRGVRVIDGTAERALAAGLKCDPPLVLPRPELVGIQDKNVLVVQIPAGLPHAYCLSGRYLTRAGKKNVPLGPRQLRQLLRERGDASTDVQPAPGATLDDLDELRITKYAATFLGEQGAMPRQAAFDLLLKRRCLIKEAGAVVPTISGLLLFGREPQVNLPSAEILLARYAGKQMTDEFLRDVARGPLPEQIRQAEAFLAANMRKGSRIDGLQRSDKAEYPMSAVREAIVNAVSHRDYGIRGDEVRVLMFSDRIEIYSPGKLPGHVTIDNLVDERFSRNEVIIQVLADMGYVERLGYGIDRMIRLMREWGLEKPRFAETANGFRVILRGPGDKLVDDQGIQSKWQQAELNERQQAALAQVLKSTRITNRDYRDLFPELSEETIRRDLADLVEKGILLKMGDKRGTFYILK